MTRPLISLVVALALGAACGGANSALRLNLQADVASAPAGTDPTTLVAETAGIIQERLTAYGAHAITVENQPDGRIIVAASAIDLETLTRLATEPGGLEFQRPVIDKDGRVVCRTLDGQLFSVPAFSVSPDPASRQLAHCFGATHSGQAEWQPAALVDANDPSQEYRLTADLIEPGGWTVREQPSPSLAVRFTEDGGRILKGLTSALVGYPLGVFVDGRLIAAPEVQRPITNGTAVITGISLGEARILSAELNFGPLPLRVTVAEGATSP